MLKKIFEDKSVISAHFYINPYVYRTAAHHHGVAKVRNYFWKKNNLDMKSRIFDWKKPESWPEDWPKLKFEHVDDPGLNLLVDRLNCDYEYIRLFHACRPGDINSYNEEGLKVAEPGQMVSEAISVFSCSENYKLSAFEVIITANEVSSGNSNKLFLSLDDRSIFKNHVQRLIYGSDYLYQIGNRLYNKIGTDFRQVLKKRGRPTIFECLVPVSRLSENMQILLAASLSRCIYAMKIGSEIDFTVILHNSLPPEYLISARYPEINYDPFE